MTQRWRLDWRGAQLGSGWRRLDPECEQPYAHRLRAFLEAEVDQGKVIYPPSDQVFRALELTPFERVKVVILGQDPYHGPDQANGLSFSVRKGIRLPPSLRNIYKELERDVAFERPEHGDLTAWAEQGVLLLNDVLTVEQGRPGAHRGKGWERFTDAIFERLNDEREQVVFMLWGNHAQKKGGSIDRRRHCVLQAPHPSPLSAHRGWFGCRHFSQTNAYLEQTGQSPIDWQLE